MTQTNVVQKLEQTVESLKSLNSNKEDPLSKKLDRQNRDLKAKLVLTENLCQKRAQEADQLRAKIEKVIHDEERYLVRDRTNFEKVVGRVASQKDDKVVMMMKMYENKCEKMEKEIERYEKEMDKMAKKIVEMES